MASDGHAGIDAMLAAVQARFPGFVLRRTSKVDSHNGQLRFSWSLGPEAGPAVVEGVDFCALAADGRLEQVVGFIDKDAGGVRRASRGFARGLLGGRAVPPPSA